MKKRDIQGLKWHVQTYHVLSSRHFFQLATAKCIKSSSFKAGFWDLDLCCWDRVLSYVKEEGMKNKSDVRVRLSAIIRKKRRVWKSKLDSGDIHYNDLCRITSGYQSK